MKYTGMIYLIQNNITQKVYVGQTTRDIETRFKEHCRRSSNCKKLSNSINKYGKNNFSIIESMIQAKAKIIYQYNLDGSFVRC
jgi:group I intron endonuclease